MQCYYGKEIIYREVKGITEKEIFLREYVKSLNIWCNNWWLRSEAFMQLAIFAIVLFRFTKQDSLQQIAFILHTVKYLKSHKKAYRSFRNLQWIFGKMVNRTTTTKIFTSTDTGYQGTHWLARRSHWNVGAHTFLFNQWCLVKVYHFPITYEGTWPSPIMVTREKAYVVLH